MKSTNKKKWLSGSDSNFLLNINAGVNVVLLALWVGLSMGCSQFNDYVAAPTIVDASERPPYITSPIEMPQTSPIPIYPLPRQSADVSEIPASDFSDNSLTVTADPLDVQQQASAFPVGSAPQAGLLYEYAPNHPGANEHGYVKMVNPAYDDQSITPPDQADRSRDFLAVRPEPQAISSPPIGDLPHVTEVTITGADPKPQRQAVSDSTARASQPPLSVRGIHVESAHLQENRVVPTVQELSFQNSAMAQAPQKVAGSPQPLAPQMDLAVSKSMFLQVPMNSATATIEELQQLIRENPDDIQKQLSLRFLYLAYRQKEKALELFPSVPSEKQAEAINIFRAAMLTAKVSGNSQRSGQIDTANRALEALNHLTEMMAEQADLEVVHLEICQDQSVKGFGQYEPLAKNLLTSGKPRTVQIYCELEHFKSQLNPDGKYITRVAASIELLDEDYRTIYLLPKTEIPDVPSYHPRRDFFFRGQIRLPRLAPGKYEIVVRVEDKFAGKIARPFRKPFEIKAPARAAP